MKACCRSRKFIFRRGHRPSFADRPFSPPCPPPPAQPFPTSPLPNVCWRGLRETGGHAASPLAGVKPVSWVNNVWAVAEANKEGFDEVVMLNERGEVAECTPATIFAVKAGKIFTPPLNSGCLEGVTRGILMEIAPEAGVSVLEQSLRPEDLYSA